MFIEKLKNKACSKPLLAVMLGILSGCSSLSLKEKTTSIPAKNISQQVSMQKQQNSDQPTPLWINSLVADLNSKPVKDSPESIAQYQYNGKIVYYFSPACCGKMSQLYDEGKNLICKPGGGEDGKGDGKCPGFIADRKNGKLIWEENRD